MSKRDKRKISVFIASPGDVKSERKQFRKAIHQLNIGFGDGADVEFEPLGWEDTLAVTGRRVQSVINEEIDRCDVFFLVMYRRWGQPAPDAKRYASYTEEEFHRALNRWKKEQKPEIFIFFRQVEAAQEADAGPQLQKVIRFRRHIQETRHILYQYIDGGEDTFLTRVDSHLRAFAKGELPQTPPKEDVDIKPINMLDAADEDVVDPSALAAQLAEAGNDLEAISQKLRALQFQAAEDATAFAEQGLLERARHKFVQLIADTTDLRILRLAHDFFQRTGDLDTTAAVLDQWLALSGNEAVSAETADALARLGELYMTQGDLAAAAAQFEKALAVNRDLERMDGLAGIYRALGVLNRTRGEVTLAKSHFEKSLVIEEIRNNPKGIAAGHRNLGNLAYDRGDLQEAREHYEKSLAIHEQIKHREGAASDYGNLANLHHMHDEFDQADKLYQKSLEINQELGNKSGMAIQYSNLGLLHQKQKAFDSAQHMYEKALALDLEMGRKEGIAAGYGSLGYLAVAQDKLDQAAEMFEKSLHLNQELGHKSGMAADFGDLGMLHQKRGDYSLALEFFEKSLALNQTLGSADGEAHQWGNMASVHEDRGEFVQAKALYEKALLIYEKLGLPNAKKVNEALKKIAEKMEHAP